MRIIALAVGCLWFSACSCLANVSIDCENTPVSDVLEGLARQSGQNISLAAPVDASVTLHMSDVPLEQALQTIAGLVGGIAVQEAGGYKVYPKPTPAFVLGLIKQNNSRIQDIEIQTERPLDGGTVRETLTWKAPNLVRIDRTSVSRAGKTATSVTVSDGASVWSHATDSTEVRKSALPSKVRRTTFAGPGYPGGLEFLSNPDESRMPGLAATEIKQVSGRAVYVLEFGDEPSEGGRQYLGGSFQRLSPHHELGYQFPRPRLDLSGGGKEVVRLEVDAATGVVLAEQLGPSFDHRRLEAQDVREIAPGVWFPDQTIQKKGKPGHEAIAEEIVAKSTRANFGPDPALFKFQPPAGVFVSDESVANANSCRELVKQRPADADLHYRLAQLLMSSQDSWREALDEYKKAASLKPAGKKTALLKALDIAARLKDSSEVSGFAAELQKTDPKSTEIAPAVAWAYAQLGQTQQALQEYGKSVALFPVRADAPLLEIAGLAQKMGDVGRAERLYLEVLAICDEHKAASAGRRLREMYANEGRLQALRKPLEEALNRLQEPAELLAEHGTLLLELGETDAAVATFKKAIAKKPESVLAASRELRRQKQDSKAKELLSNYLLTPGDDSGRLDAYREILDLNQAEDSSVEQSLDFYVQAASAAAESWAREGMRSTFLGFLERRQVRKEALAEVREIWQKDPANAVAAALLANLAVPRSPADKDYDAKEAAAVLKQLTAQFPNASGLYALLGEAYLTAKSWDDALTAFRQGSRLDPDQPYYPAQIVYTHIEAGNAQGALEAGKELVARNPESYVPRFVLGCAHFSAGRYREAAAEFAEGDRLLQSAGNAGMLGPWVINQAIEPIITCYTRLKDSESAIRYMHAWVERAASDRERAQALGRIAGRYIADGNVQGAVNAVIEIEQTSPEDASAETIRSFSWSIPHDKKQAFLDSLQQALKDKEGLIYSRLLLAEAYLDTGKASEAGAIITDLLAKAGDNAGLVRRLAETAQRHGSLSGLALDAYKRLAALQPDQLQNEISLVTAYANAGRKTEALEEARKLLRKHDTSPHAASAAGGIFRRFQAWEESISAFEKAINLDPQGADQYKIDLAAVYSASNRDNEAISLLTEVLAGTDQQFRKMTCLRHLAEIYRRQNNIEQAVAFLREMIATSTNDWEKQSIQKQIDELMKPKT